ncbi:MAG: RNA polymerase subunit sigma, partial [Bacteroidales bacterium]|nr:RNA polymerase subunit sigma [Bacteroidales bacterium]
PNDAHKVLAKWENAGLLKGIVTQNIDFLHQTAGSRRVVEFHGSKGHFECMNCGKKYPTSSLTLTDAVPRCECGGVLKPGFVFFGEGIPEDAYNESFGMAEKCDVMIVIGTTGEVQPASYIPHMAKKNGAVIIEVNPKPSAFTNCITDVFVDTGAVEALTKIDCELQKLGK